MVPKKKKFSTIETCNKSQSRLRVCLVGRKRERKERGGGKREKKMEKCVFGMERKMEGREKWKEKPINDQNFGTIGKFRLHLL